MDLCIYNRDDSCCYECPGCIYSMYRNNDSENEDFQIDYIREEEVIKKYEEDKTLRNELIRLRYI